MPTSPRRRVARFGLSLVIGAGTLTGAAAFSTPLALAASTDAPTCVKAATPATTPATTVPVTCPTIVSVTVGSAWVRSSTATLTYPVTVVVADPANIAREVDTLMGRGLDQVFTPSTLVVGFGDTNAFRLISGTNKKTFTLTVESPHRPLDPEGAAPAYGGFQINATVWGADPSDPADAPLGQFLGQVWRSGSIKARSVVTNTPSATSVRKGQSFTERGKLTRFDGSPQRGQKVNVYYVPAGQTKASYAGTTTTSREGKWSLPVRSWFTGSWFVSYPGSSFSTSVYKGAWVRVS